MLQIGFITHFSKIISHAEMDVQNAMNWMSVGNVTKTTTGCLVMLMVNAINVKHDNSGTI